MFLFYWTVIFVRTRNPYSSEYPPRLVSSIGWMVSTLELERDESIFTLFICISRGHTKKKNKNENQGDILLEMRAFVLFVILSLGPRVTLWHITDVLY